MKKFKIVREEKEVVLREYEYIILAESMEHAIQELSEDDANIVDVEMLNDYQIDFLDKKITNVKEIETS